MAASRTIRGTRRAAELAAGATLNDTFTYRATDGSAFSLPATVTIVVTGVNDAPVASE